MRLRRKIWGTCLMPAKITNLCAWFKTRYEVADNGCWLWIGAKYSNGYGQTKIPGTRKFTGAHRLSYQIHISAIPNGLVLDHLCGNKGCVNPTHLEVVSQKENLRRAGTTDRIVAMAHERHEAKHCSRGHLLDGENLYVYPNGKHRACKICMAMLRRSYQQKIKEISA